MRYDDEEILLQEYLSLQSIVKPLSKRIEEIRNWCKEKGSFHTKSFVCSVEPRSRLGMVSLEEAIGILGKEGVQELGLSKTSEFLLVHISKKELV